MFYKLLSILILPTTFCSLILLTGVIIRWRGQSPKLAKGLIYCGILLLIWFSSYPGSWLTVAPLEFRYKPLLEKNNEDIKYIIVLGGGHISDQNLPVSSKLTTETARRLLEGLRLHKLYPEARLVLSGGLESNPTSVIMCKMMLDAGLDTSGVILSSRPANTEEEAKEMKKIAGTGKIMIVTSAVHMPRAVILFKRYDMEVIPCPADNMLRKDFFEFSLWGINPGYLTQSNKAFHEYFGILWLRLKGLFSN